MCICIIIIIVTTPVHDCSIVCKGLLENRLPENIAKGPCELSSPSPKGGSEKGDPTSTSLPSHF